MAKTKIEKLDLEEMPVFFVNKEHEDQSEIEVEVGQQPTSLGEMPDVTTPPTKQELEKDMNIPVFALSLLQIADQAKIIHLQSTCKNEHETMGDFYDEFVLLTDSLIESIAGKYGIDKLSFGEAAISLMDRALAISSFFDVCDEILRNNSCILFDKDNDTEIFAKIDEMLMLKNKTQYLLQMK